jgi:hypothetical protein
MMMTFFIPLLLSSLPHRFLCRPSVSLLPYLSPCIYFIYTLLNDAFSVTQMLYCIGWNEMMMGEWWIWKDIQGSGRGLILRFYPSICLEGMRKTTKNLSQDIRSPGWYFNPGLPEYEAGVLTNWSRRSVFINVKPSCYIRRVLISYQLNYAIVLYEVRTYHLSWALVYGFSWSNNHKARILEIW